LGCISVSKQFYIIAGIDEKDIPVDDKIQCECPPDGFWKSLWNQLISILKMIYVMLHAIFNRLISAVKKSEGDNDPGGPDSTGPAGGGSGGNPPATPSGGGAAVASQSLQVYQKETAEESNEVGRKTPAGSNAARVSTAKKKPAPRKKTTKKRSTTNKSSNNVTPADKTIVKKKTDLNETNKEKEIKNKSFKKGRRGIRLNPGLDYK
jgi:hypothetical protein